MTSNGNGYTPQAIRNRNYQVIINLLRESEVRSIRDIVLRSSLSKTAVKRIIDNLLEAGLVCPAGKGQSSEAGGKRPELFMLHAGQVYALSCIFGQNGFRFILVDLKLQVIDCVDALTLYPGASYQQITQSMADAIRQFLMRHPEVCDRLCCICFSTAGIISYSDGVLINPIHNNQWGSHLPFLSDMRKLLPMSCPFYFDNALRFAAYYEQMMDSSLQKGSVLMICYTRDNIGGSILQDSQLVHGRFGLSGEFGHILTDFALSETCSCGKTGCIESVAAHKRVVARAERELQNWPMSVLNGRELSFASISNAADAGDIFAQRQMDFLVHQFSTLIYNLQIAIDPDILVLKCYTDHVPMHYFSSSIQETVNRLSLVNTPIPIRIHVDQHGDDYDMMYHNIICGGALYGFDRLFYTESMFNEFIARYVDGRASAVKQREESEKAVPPLDSRTL